MLSIAEDDQWRTAATDPRLTGDLAVLAALSAFLFALHAAFGGGFGYHHDELYFVACGERFALGYVDQPPLVPWLAALSRWLFGESLRGLRFFPAVAGAAGLFLTGLLARRLGAGRFGQIVASLGYLIAPVFLRSQNLLAIPAFEPLFWAGCSYLVVRIIQEDRPRLWLAVGALAGAGLMNKHTMLFYGAGLVAGLLLTPHRRQLRTFWPWLGGAAALVIFLPNLVWQAQNGWPTLQFLKGINVRVMGAIPLTEFLVGQVLYMHPFNLVVWGAGLIFFFGMAAGKPYRLLGWIYVAVLVLLIAAKSKIYYLGPAYPMLLAGGGVALERLAGRRRWGWLRPALPALLLFAGVSFAPVALPILPIDATDRFVKVATFGAVKNSYELTADLHDQFGWEELVALAARGWESLSEDEKRRAIILADDRGAAAAIDFFGHRHDLPPARSGVLSYWLWGWGDGPADIVVGVGFRRRTLDQFCGDVTEIATFTDARVNPWRNNQLVAVCREPKLSIAELWPQLKRWD